MGRAARLKPVHLGSKLQRIRLALGLTLEGMVERLGVMDTLTRASVLTYESGLREPPLPVLYEYAKLAAGISGSTVAECLEALVADHLDLPGRIFKVRKNVDVNVPTSSPSARAKKNAARGK